MDEIVYGPFPTPRFSNACIRSDWHNGKTHSSIHTRVLERLGLARLSQLAGWRSQKANKMVSRFC